MKTSEAVQEWINWSGSLTFKPREFVRPEKEDELSALVKECYDAGKKIRVTGAGHSSSPLVETDQASVKLDRLKGVFTIIRIKVQ